MFKILELANVWFSRFHYFALNFAVNLHCALSFAFFKANSLQFSAEIYYKVVKSREPNIC